MGGGGSHGGDEGLTAELRAGAWRLMGWSGEASGLGSGTPGFFFFFVCVANLSLSIPI